MFFHNVKYYTLATFKEKSVVFWLLLFPIVLATFFHVAFSGIYDQDFLNKAIPVAVVINEENPSFRQVMDGLSEGDDKMFDTKYTDEDEALKLLGDGDVSGVIYVDPNLSLTVHGEGLDQTVIRSFIDRYTVTETVITETAMKDPTKIQEVTAAFSQELNANKSEQLNVGNMDIYVTYMYNLIAMVCILGSTVGISIAMNNEANLSGRGMRSCLSPAGKLVKNMAGLVSGCIVQTICSTVASVYIVFVLRENLGVPFGYVLLTSAVGSWAGVAIGYFAGSIGKLGESARTGLMIGISMVMCFFSGLMMGDMKMIVEDNFPILNRISPPALICDSFYVLNVDADKTRYITKMATLAAIIVIFTLLGTVFTRRKRYASL